MFTIYSSPDCSGCKTAKKLLQKTNQTYEEVDVFESDDGLEVMREHQWRTVPLILHNNVKVGGVAELKEYLENSHEG